MKVEVAAFPFGEIEGAPVLALHVPEGTTAEALIEEVQKNKRPGLAGVWLIEAPWDDPEWDRVLLNLIANESTSGLNVITMPPVESMFRTGLDLYVIADASEITSGKYKPGQVVGAINSLGGMPTLQEVIIRQPPIESLSPVLLDELFSCLDPVGSATLYSPPGDDDYSREALNVITRCGTPWKLRTDHETVKGGA